MYYTELIRMKRILTFILIVSLFSCNKESNDNNDLQNEISALQSEIKVVSNEIEAYLLQGLKYNDEVVANKISEFTNKRTDQSNKIEELKTRFDEDPNIEYVVCGQFESINCFVENWDIRKSEDATVGIDDHCSYNETQSLRLSAPFIEGAFNVPGLEIESYINGIQASTIYKIRFWMKYSGQTDLSNGPLTHMIIIQDGEWLDYLYEGFHEINESKEVDKDWKLYSFQIASKTASPLEIIFGTNLSDVCIDDIHIVKKDQ